MARSRRYCPPGTPQHLIQRGNNKQACFLDDQDKAVYCSYLAELLSQGDVALHAWVLMDNHVHLLATPLAESALSTLMQALGRRFVRYFNRRHQRTGTLWEGRFRSCLIDSEAYLLRCQRYIENNPVRAGMVRHPGHYGWSSYRCHINQREADMHTPHELYLALGRSVHQRSSAYAELFSEVSSDAELDTIRKAVHTGGIL